MLVDPPRCPHCALFDGTDLRARLSLARRHAQPRRVLPELHDRYRDQYSYTQRRVDDYDWDSPPSRRYSRATAAAGSARALEAPPARGEFGSRPRVESPRSRSPQIDYEDDYAGTSRRDLSRSPSPDIEEDEEEEIPSYQPRRDHDRGERHAAVFRVLDEVGAPERIALHDEPPAIASRPALGPPPPRNDPPPPAQAAPAAATGAEQPEAEQQKEEPTMLAIYKVATTRCGLKWPGDEDKPPASQEGWQGQDKEKAEPKVAKRSKLPTAKGFAAVLTSSWEKPADKESDPKKMRFNVDFEDSDRLGLGRLPPMDPALTDFFLRDAGRGQKAPFSLTKDGPAFTVEADKTGSANNKKVYDAAAACVKALNAAALLQGSLRELLVETQDSATQQQLSEMRRLMQEIIMLNKHSTEWAGRVLGHCVALERIRWLNHVNFQGPDDKKHLLNLKVHPDNLFHGAMAYIQDSLAEQRLRDEAAQTCLKLAPKRPPASSSSSQPQQRGRAAQKKQDDHQSPPHTSSSSRSRDRQPDRRTDDRIPQGRGRGRGGWHKKGYNQQRK